MSKHNAESVANALRKRICLQPPTSSTVLHEQVLAEEFNISRTPVRQALQRLAYERLVEVRSGIGTMVVELDPARKEQDLQVAFALSKAAAEIEGDRPLSMEARTYLIALDRQVNEATSIDLETNYAIRAAAIDIIAREMDDQILADALKAALWRLFRWRLAEAADMTSGIDPRLPEIMTRMAEATETGTLGAVLRAQYVKSNVS